MTATRKELNEMIEAVTLAIPREIEAQNAYLKAARLSSGEESKKLFLALAQQEKGHEKVLKDLLSRLKKELQNL